MYITMSTTTIQINGDIRDKLSELKMSSRETYNDVLERVLEDFEELSEETRLSIEEARKEIKEGKFKTHEEVKAQLGF